MKASSVVPPPGSVMDIVNISGLSSSKLLNNDTVNTSMRRSVVGNVVVIDAKFYSILLATDEHGLTRIKDSVCDEYSRLNSLSVFHQC